MDTHPPLPTPAQPIVTQRHWQTLETASNHHAKIVMTNAVLATLAVIIVVAAVVWITRRVTQPRHDFTSVNRYRGYLHELGRR